MILEMVAMILHKRLTSLPVRRPEWAKLPWGELSESRKRKALEDAKGFIRLVENMGLRLVKKNEIVYINRPTNPLRVRRRNPDGSLEIINTNREE